MCHSVLVNDPEMIEAQKTRGQGGKKWATKTALVGPAPRRAESSQAALLAMLRGMFAIKRVDITESQGKS